MALGIGSLFPMDKKDEMVDNPPKSTGFYPKEYDDEDKHQEKAARKLVSRQKAIVQEQRLQTLFQMLGLTLHELNQPLTSLLGNIELIGLYRENPEKLDEFLKRLESAGKRLSGVVKKMQDIRGEINIPRFDLTHEQALGKSFHILAMVRSDESYLKVRESLANLPGITIQRFSTADGAASGFNSSAIDMLFVDESFYKHSKPRFVMDIKDRFIKAPLVVIVDGARGSGFWFAIEDMAEEYLVKEEIDHQALVRVIENSMETVLLKKRHAFGLDKIAEIYQIDPVTRLPQRRFFTDVVEREIIKSARNETAFVIYKIVIHDMKNKMDAGQKEAVSRMLSDTVSILLGFVGKNDTLCRYDNQSFAFILPAPPGFDSDDVCKKLEKLFRSPLNESLSPMPPIKVSIHALFHSYKNPCTGNDLIKKMV